MDKQESDLKFIKARNKVEKLKRFYTHVAVYFVLNTIFVVLKIMRNLDNGETFSEAFFDTGTIITWSVWGIALAIHAFSVFGIPLILGDDWEERKIEKYMNEELKNDKNI